MSREPSTSGDATGRERLDDGSKPSLRRVLRAARRAVDAAERRRRDHALCERLRTYVQEIDATTLALFRAVDGEPDLSALADEAGLTAVFPRVVGRDLHFAPADDGWSPGPFGIAEPRAEALRDVEAELDLVVVPALAVDTDGVRLGYGGGFYDRWLAAHPRLRERTICAVDEVHPTRLPRAAHDIPVAAIVTPQRLLRIGTDDAGCATPVQAADSPRSGRDREERDG